MHRTFLFLLLLVSFGISQVYAREKLLQKRDCRKIVGIKDSDRRAFDSRASIQIDMDADGKPDTITPRTYSVKVKRKASVKTKWQPREIHWIAFDLKTGKGQTISSFFKYNYGTDSSDYWVYAFVPCSINRDSKTDLLFYSGDDTSEEKIILVNRGNAFKVYSRKVEDLNE